MCCKSYSLTQHYQAELVDKLKTREFLADEIDGAISDCLKTYLTDERYALSRSYEHVNRSYGWLYIANELKQKGVSATIIQILRESCEIDWYLQAELAYNKRFGIKDSVEVDFDESLDKKSK